MGIHCCCGVKIRKGERECECDWTGWITFKGEEPLEQPKKDGKYLVRYSDNGGDSFEDEWFFSVKCLNKQELIYSDKKFEKHWQHESWDDNHVYAWKNV